MCHHRNILFCYVGFGVLLTFASPLSIREKRVSRSPDLSKLLQTPEQNPVESKSAINSQKFDVNSFIKKTTISRLVPSNLHGFQYEVYFPPHQKISKQSTENDNNIVDNSGDVIKTSATSEFQSVLSPSREIVRNMEIRPPLDNAEYHDIAQDKDNDGPEFAGYFYDPPPSTSTDVSFCHHGTEHDTPEDAGYVYEPPPNIDPILDENLLKSLSPLQAKGNIGATEYPKSISQSNESYLLSASNNQETIQEQENHHRIDSEYPNYSTVRFRSSFFGEDGLPRLLSEEESDHISPEYNFGYLIRGETELGHEESLVDKAAKGAYHVLLPDGRLQHVQYEADERGYRPVVRYHQS